MSDVSFQKIGQKAKQACPYLQRTSIQIIHSILEEIAKNIKSSSHAVLKANELDLEEAKKNGRDAAFIDRLRLDENRLSQISESLQNIIQQPDPVGRILDENHRPNNLLIRKISTPIGVIGMIYESRPNVTIDAAALSLKSRNALILRGGSESLNSNQALHKVISDSLVAFNLPSTCVQLIPSTNRDLVNKMLNAPEYIDVLIPRGGKSLTSKIMSQARMPVFAHLEGICHLYVHTSVNPDIASQVVINSKMRRTGICGAAETLLLDQNLAQPIKKELISQLIKHGCEVRGDETLQTLDTRIIPADEQDWHTEYLAPVISAKIVSDINQAIGHINQFGSHHTDSILAEDHSAVERFLKEVDSGIVIHNASTQFADGGEFGMGAEMGISTGKLHARGPVSLQQLTTYKYQVSGTGQIRA